MLSATVVHDSEGAAAAVTVRNASSHTLRSVPIAITVKERRRADALPEQRPGPRSGTDSDLLAARARHGDLGGRPGPHRRGTGERERRSSAKPRPRAGPNRGSKCRVRTWPKPPRAKSSGTVRNSSSVAQQQSRRLRDRAPRGQDRRRRQGGAGRSGGRRLGPVPGVSRGQPGRRAVGSERSGEHVRVRMRGWLLSAPSVPERERSLHRLVQRTFVELNRSDLVTRDPDSFGASCSLHEPVVLGVDRPPLRDEQVLRMLGVAREAALTEVATDDSAVRPRTPYRLRPSRTMTAPSRCSYHFHMNARFGAHTIA